MYLSNTYFYVLEKRGRGEREERESSLCWFMLQMLATASARSTTPSGALMRVTSPKHSSHYLLPPRKPDQKWSSPRLALYSVMWASRVAASLCTTAPTPRVGVDDWPFGNHVLIPLPTVPASLRDPSGLRDAISSGSGMSSRSRLGTYSSL